MQKVKNQKCISNISKKSLKTAKARNIIAVLAIAMTTMLFTSVFMIAISMNRSFEEQNFRRAGGTFHGVFKDITDEQMNVLEENPLIKSAGGRLMLGIPSQAPFIKNSLEVSYVDNTCAEAMFCKPDVGEYPKEGTREAATDTRVLKLLGVEPEIGAEFTLTYDLGSGTAAPQTVTETFTLSGYWEYNAAVATSFVNVPFSYAREVLGSYTRQGEWDLTGQWDLYVNFKSSLHIESDLEEVLKECGYQNQDESADNFIGTGVNWGYTGAQLSQNLDPGVAAAMAAAILLIILTGYLIIYNIFRISVTGDIRFYGLLKTIGTTGRQIRRILRRQVRILACIGIPAGLIVGWVTGSILMPVIMKSMLSSSVAISFSPWIFIGAAAFSYLTVLLSCQKPARMASKVTPVEAVRYTEKAIHKKEKKGEKGARIFRMARANLGRSKSKTILVILSLALAVLLLNITVMFANGFDMDKYLKEFVSADYVTGHTAYFDSRFGNVQQGIPQEMISAIDSQGGISASGRTYGQTTLSMEYIDEEYARRKISDIPSRKSLDQQIEEMRKDMDENGLFPYSTRLYGMEKFPLSKLNILEGDLAKLDSGEDYIAAVVQLDDYGKEIAGAQHCQVGDQIKIKFVEEYEYIDSRTGEFADDTTPEEYMEYEEIKSHIKTYTVCARVEILRTMSYRSYGQEEFILPADEFKEQTGSSSVMNYLFDMKDQKSDRAMEEFLKEYTENVESNYDYESKSSYESQFYGFRDMFLLTGGLLSLVIGIIGILNFINAVVTSVISRKREFAVLQAVGMTGKQLRQMLVLEGCMYGGGAVVLALVLSLIFSPMLAEVLSSMFWFFTYHVTFGGIVVIIPVFLLLGTVIPSFSYKSLNKQAIVERIREVE